MYLHGQFSSFLRLLSTPEMGFTCYETPCMSAIKRIHNIQGSVYTYSNVENSEVSTMYIDHLRTPLDK